MSRPIRHQAPLGAGVSPTCRLSPMQLLTVEGRYPVWFEEIAKADTCWRDVDEIAALLQGCIHRQPGFVFIGLIDHYALNIRLGEALPVPLQDAKVVLFFPDTRQLTPALLAYYPTAIGVADMGNRFVISFLNISTVSPTESLIEWVESIRASATPTH